LRYLKKITIKYATHFEQNLMYNEFTIFKVVRHSIEISRCRYIEIFLQWKQVLYIHFAGPFIVYYRTKCRVLIYSDLSEITVKISEYSGTYYTIFPLEMSNISVRIISTKQLGIIYFMKLVFIFHVH
jgi:hypothetical protein